MSHKSKKRDKKKHRRDREPIIVEAPKKLRIKLQPSPKLKDVMKARASIYRKLKRTGVKRYKRHRDRVDQDVNAVLKKYGLLKTSVENYWRLCFTCILIGQ
jgi:hypothetical protein